jgi:signal transduction histidine kinase
MTGIECELDIPAQLPSHPISAQARHHLFLALHEAFTNTLKHSGATRSKVSASCGASVFEISMSDNGTGFDASSTRLEGMESGNGLRNMRRRLAEIGGSCEVQSAPGKGTSIRFVFPLNGSMKQATL